ncbi:MAG: flagellin hook IN motif-containing protein, partial [Betaproteobacteria bacterium]
TDATDSIIINGNSLSKTISVTAGDSAQNVAANINKVSGETGVTAVAKTYAHYYSRSAADETASLKINGITTGEFVISGTNVLDAVDKINAISGSTGVTASATSDYKVRLYASSGKDITIE